ncbi:MAG: class I SAM-dependent methyltransferase [Phycisphaerales bacterium]|nr:class I SAM-dependent methyltransferase [Phycisphaerales bacterium]
MNLDSLRVRDESKLGAIRDAYVGAFFPGVEVSRLRSGDIEKDIEANTSGRYDRTLSKVIPWIQRVFDLRGARVLEIGSGTGSSGAAIAQVAGEVLGVEPKGNCLEVANRRVEVMGLGNVRFLPYASPEVFQHLDQLLAPPLDVVMLSAVLEHQTIPERLQTLRKSWDSLRPGGIIVVAETPNRLTYMDGHTSQMMFFDLLETELALRAYRFSPRADFVRVMDACAAVSWKAAQEMLIRRGRGVSFYDFDVALPGRPYRVLADGYEPEPLEAFGITYEERLLQSCIATHRLDVPPVFQRHTIYGIFQKPDGDAPAPECPKREFSPLAATREDLRRVASLLSAGETGEALRLVQQLAK